MRKLSEIRGGPLVKRFTKRQAEFAAKVSNDIAEDMDLGESREELRMVVAYFQDLACVEAVERARLQSMLTAAKYGAEIVKISLEGLDGVKEPLS